MLIRKKTILSLQKAKNNTFLTEIDHKKIIYCLKIIFLFHHYLSHCFHFYIWSRYRQIFLKKAKIYDKKKYKRF